MGLMRALTLKRASGIPTRSFSNLKGRPQISLPTELISTTNKLSYTAPSVQSMQEKAAAEQLSTAVVVFESDSASTIASDAVPELDYSQTPTSPSTVSERSSRQSSHQRSGSEPSLTDASSVSSHFSPPSSPPTYQSITSPTSYFVTDSFAKPSSATTSLIEEDGIDPLMTPVPALPRRAPSHSKHEHERLARRRSQRVSMKLEVAALVADDLLSPAPLSSAMPGLAEVDEETVPQVTVVEIAEEPSLEQLMESMIIEDDDVRHMREHGLKRFSVGGYLDIVADIWDNELFVADDVATVA